MAGIAVGAVGIDALRHVHQRAELPLAAIPVILGGHQLIEAFVWWGLQGRGPSHMAQRASWLYLAVAFGVLPVLVPVAVGALEPVANRRRFHAFTALGAAVAAILMYAVVRGPIDAKIQIDHVAYHVRLWHGGVLVALYVVATCGSMLVSKNRNVRRFGMANLLAVAILSWLTESAFISLWCAWAAITSIAIAAHLRRAHQPTTKRFFPAHR